MGKIIDNSKSLLYLDAIEERHGFEAFIWEISVNRIPRIYVVFMMILEGRMVKRTLMVVVLALGMFGCGAPSMYTLRPIEYSESAKAQYNIDIVLYLSKELRDYTFYQYGFKSQLGQILIPSIVDVTSSTFARVHIVEDQAELEQYIGTKPILIPRIVTAWRDETGATTTWSDCRTKVELKWELRTLERTIAWETLAKGEAVKNMGNVFTRKKNIQQSLKTASEEAVKNSYDLISSSDAIAAYVNSLK